MQFPDLTLDRENEVEWTVIAECVTKQGETMDVYAIVDVIYRHVEKFMPQSCLVMQPGFIARPVSLVLDTGVRNVCGVSMPNVFLVLM